MIVDVSGILKEMGGKIKIDGEFSVEDLSFLGESFHFEKPLTIQGEIYNNGKSLRLSAEVSGEMGVHCSRCMTPFVTDVHFDTVEDFMQESEEVTDEDVILFSGNKIDLTEVIIDNFYMNVSGKYLCSEDCKGLCTKCGKNLNLGDCGCENDDIDPRWEALKKIMDSTDN